MASVAPNGFNATGQALAKAAPYVKAATILGGAIGAGVLLATINAYNAAGSDPNKRNPFNTNDLFMFPHNLTTVMGKRFGMVFNFYKYDRPSILHIPTLIPFGAVALPLPSDMVDQLGLNYQESNSRTNPAVGAGMENAKNIEDAISSPSFTNAWSALSSGAEALAMNAGTNLSKENYMAKGLQMAGMAQNPFLSILFDSPLFKRFTFSWTFVPENQGDSDTLRTILDKFRYHASPDVVGDTGGMLLAYPDMCVPVIYPNEYMFNMKQCVIEHVDISYSPGQTPGFFPSNAPNAINLKLSLLEIEYWVKADFLNERYHTPQFVA